MPVNFGAVDTSAYGSMAGSGQRITLSDLLNAAGTGLNLYDKYKQNQGSRFVNSTLADALKGSTPDTLSDKQFEGYKNVIAQRPDLMNTVLPGLKQAADDKAKRKKEYTELEKSVIALNQTKQEILAGILENVNDQGTLDRGFQVLDQFGIDHSHIPKDFNQVGQNKGLYVSAALANKANLQRIRDEAATTSARQGADKAVIDTKIAGADLYKRQTDNKTLAESNSVQLDLDKAEKARRDAEAAKLQKEADQLGDRPALPKMVADDLEKATNVRENVGELLTMLNTGKVDALYNIFTNPKASAIVTELKNARGRVESGAAISAKEWDVFEQLVLNRKNLLSDAGKAQAKATLEAWLARTEAKGANLTGRTDWFKEYGTDKKRIIDDFYGNQQPVPQAQKPTQNTVQQPTFRLVSVRSK